MKRHHLLCINKGCLCVHVYLYGLCIQAGFTLQLALNSICVHLLIVMRETHSGQTCQSRAWPSIVYPAFEERGKQAQNNSVNVAFHRSVLLASTSELNLTWRSDVWAWRTSRYLYQEAPLPPSDRPFMLLVTLHTELAGSHPVLGIGAVRCSVGHTSSAVARNLEVWPQSGPLGLPRLCHTHKCTDTLPTSQTVHTWYFVIFVEVSVLKVRSFWIVFSCHAPDNLWQLHTSVSAVRLSELFLG